MEGASLDHPSVSMVAGLRSLQRIDIAVAKKKKTPCDFQDKEQNDVQPFLLLFFL